MSDEELEIAVDGEVLGGWQDVTVLRAFDRLAGSFSLRIAELELADPRARKLRRGDFVRIEIAGAVVLSGYVGRREKSFDGASNTITLSGRDIVADLIDCSATAVPGEWNGARVATIAAELAAPFDLLKFRPDLSDPTLGSVEKFALQTGETAHAALDRLARMRGFLLLSDLAGGFYFGRPGSSRAPVALERGSNIEGGTLSEDEGERFSRYVVNGQAASPAWWDAGAGPGQSFQATATDPGVARARSMVMQAEAAAGEPDLQARADFEANVRAARSARVSYVLPGWTLDGYLWNPGELVSVFDPILEVGTEAGAPVDMLIAAVEWSRGAASGSRTKLELAAAGAFALGPPPAPSGGGEHWTG